MEYSNTEVHKPREAATSKKKKEEDRYEAIAGQVQDELKVEEDYVRPWRETKRGYLKLYVNQRKSPQKVSDTLIFSTHQTVLASLFNDRLDAELADTRGGGRAEGRRPQRPLGVRPRGDGAGPSTTLASTSTRPALAWPGRTGRTSTANP